MPILTSSNVAIAILKLIAADALPALLGDLIVGNLVHRDYEPTLGQAGDTVNIPVAPLDNEIQRPLGNAPIMLDTHVEATFRIPDITRVLAVPDLLKLYMQPAIAALTERIESNLLALYPGFTANAIEGTPGVPITEALLDAAETSLKQIPPFAAKYLVVNPASYSFLRQNPRFCEFNTAGCMGLRALVDGVVGKWKDFYVFRSEFVKQTGSNPVSTHNLAFARDAIALVMRRLPQSLPGTGVIAEYAELGNFGMRVLMTYQPNSLSQIFTIDMLYGAGILHNSFGVQVNS